MSPSAGVLAPRHLDAARGCGLSLDIWRRSEGSSQLNKVPAERIIEIERNLRPVFPPLVVLLVLTIASCGAPSASQAGRHAPTLERPAPSAARTGTDFIASAIRPWPSADSLTRLVVTTPTGTRAAVYDCALVSLVLDRKGRHEEAGRILEALAALQRPDGAIPFSVDLAQRENPAPYVRCGALAWVGYAAAIYLDASPLGPARAAVVRMAHRIAEYLLAHTITKPGDPRQGLVTGGEGSVEYELGENGLEERFVAGDVEWASVEHNVDTFFFLRALGRIAGQAEYAAASARIASALNARAWDPDAGQFRRGVRPGGVDDTLALDCASWGSLFLVAAGQRLRAETAFATADARFASRDPRSGVAGHKPYASGPLLEDPAAAAFLARDRPGNWESMRAVWPEGSAGVALAALRLGHRERAEAILAELERMRDADGGLPMMTTAIPFEFDTLPSVAAAAWVELVRTELDMPGAPPFVWAPAP